MSYRSRLCRHALLAIVLAAILALPRAALADSPATADPRLPSAPLHESVLEIAGDPTRPVTLQVTLFTPAGPGPFPLAVLNHGATDAKASNRGERYRTTISAYYFLSRGYAVALPMMRGFAGSGGDFVHLGCSLSLVADRNARDVRAVIEAMALRPEIDRSRIVVAGQSFGGWNTLGVGAAPPPGIRGIIAFNAAIRSSDCAAQDNAMVTSAGQLGGRTTLPSLWFYGDNDSVMPNATWHAVFEAYKGSGARAELVDVGRFGSDSHQVLSSPLSMPLWVPKVDAFLAHIGLPSTPIYPDYLPHRSPPASHFAALSDAAAVPFLNDEGRTRYQKFLQSPQPRAFVIAPGGWSASSSGYDPVAFALASCSRALPDCQLYAVNDDVVWTGPKRGDAALIPSRLVTKAVAMNVSTLLGAFFTVNAACGSRGLPKVTIAGLPVHGAAIVGLYDGHPAFPPNHPYAACNAALIPGVRVTYTPAPGFTGTDVLNIDELDVDGNRQVIRIELHVS